MKKNNDIKILIVDDESGVRSVLNRFLTETGYNCETAVNVSEAKKLLDIHSFDLLLSDLKMPEETGLDLFKYSKERYPKMGRVLITAFSSQEIATEVMEVGVYGYIIKPASKDDILITVANALHHLHLDLAMMEGKAEVERKLASRSKKLNVILDNLPVGIAMVSPQMQLLEINKKMLEWFPNADVKQDPCCYHVLQSPPKDAACNDCPVKTCLSTNERFQIIREIETNNGMRDYQITASPIYDSKGEISAVLAIYDDITDKLVIEEDLRRAQKLEAVGQLAAGIAHEINSPVQYVGDNIQFLKESFEDINNVTNCYSANWKKLEELGNIPDEINQQVKETLLAADMDYLNEEIPQTILQSADGMKRIENIVRAMKDFSHPDDQEKVITDLNKVIDSTITVCKNEWKYVAKLKTEFDKDLPVVSCFANEMSQVFLNIIVNGAHAIADFNDSGELGTITIKTSSSDNGFVTIEITDTGGGVPEKIRDKVFEPFFTTKERGKGTGQGLAIAHRVVTKKHKGTLELDVTEGIGTTFIIRVPC